MFKVHRDSTYPDFIKYFEKRLNPINYSRPSGRECFQIAFSDIIQKLINHDFFFFAFDLHSWKLLGTERSGE